MEKNKIYKIQNAICKIDDAIVEIPFELRAVTSVEQLIEFKDEFFGALEKILKNKLPEKHNRELGISKIISDQWPFDSKLGAILIFAEQAYKTYGFSN